VYWFCTKFGQLILRKIIKIVATRCQILRPKCTKFDFGWGSAPDPAGGAYNAPPEPRAGFTGPTSKGDGKGGRRGDAKGWVDPQSFAEMTQLIRMWIWDQFFTLLNTDRCAFYMTHGDSATALAEFALSESSCLYYYVSSVCLCSLNFKTLHGTLTVTVAGIVDPHSRRVEWNDSVDECKLETGHRNRCHIVGYRHLAAAVRNTNSQTRWYEMNQLSGVASAWQHYHDNIF